MAKNKGITIDPRHFFKGLDLYDKKQLETALRAMTQNGLDLRKEAALLAPKDEGTLEGNINDRTKVTKGKAEIETTVGSGESYAALVHETMEPAPDAIMKQGPVTRKKPSTEFGEAGGKFLSRPLFGKQKRYMQHVAKMLRGMKGKR